MSESNGGQRSPSPIKFSHAVLRTTRFKEMVDWYVTVLNAEVLMRTDFIAFMTYDDEHHRIAIASFPGTVERHERDAGLDHLSYTYASLGDLVATYERLKAANILPRICINHGLTTSMYYRDPDGNGVELQIDNLKPSEWKDWMRHGMSKENPVGVKYDPEDLVRRFRAGESFADITRYDTSSRLDPEVIRRLAD